MNIYAIIIIIALLANYLLDTISDYLNIKHLNKEIPDEFVGIFDEDSYIKSQNYLKESTRFGFIEDTFNMLLLFAFWFFNGFYIVDSYLQSHFSSPIGRGVVFIYGIFLVNSFLNMPFRLYDTFVIEEKFGFNKTTAKTFILDILKGLGLSIILGAPLLGLFLWILNNLGANAWFYGFLAVSAFSLIMQYIAPTWIMPIFNKFTPLEDGDLKSRILDYAEKVQYPLKNLFIIDGSKRSSKANAFFAGFGKNKRIALYDTLVQNHSVDEIVAVLAHEIGHFKKKHVLQGTIIMLIQTFFMFYLLSIFLNNPMLYMAFGMPQPQFYAGLLFFGMLFTPISMIISTLVNIFSRKNEFEADAFAATTADLSDSLISALKKLSKQNLSNLSPHPFYVFINYSHPPVLERIKALKGLKNDSY